MAIAGVIDNQHKIAENGIIVTKIKDGGAAAKDGKIKVGDVIIAVNKPLLVGV